MAMTDSTLLHMQEGDEEIPPVKQPFNAKGWTRYARLPLVILALGGTLLFATSFDKPKVGASIATPGVIIKAATNGDVMPDFEATSTIGKIKFHDWVGDSWSLLLAVGQNFEPVAFGELVQMKKYSDQFDKRGVKLIALIADNVESTNAFIGDVKKFTDDRFQIPVISDEKRDISVMLDLMDPDKKDKKVPALFNTAFVIGADKKVKTKLQYAPNVGFNFDELIRVIDALQLVAVKKIATPANWKMGNEALVAPSVKQEDVRNIFPQGVRDEQLPSGKAYLRFTTDYQ